MMASVFTFLLSALLLLIPLQHAAQAATMASPSSFPCPDFAGQPYSLGPDDLTSIPASAEICAPYGKPLSDGQANVTYYYISINSPLRPSNLIYEPSGTATYSNSGAPADQKKDANIKITWSCPKDGQITPVDFPGTCQDAFPSNIRVPAFPISALVSFDYEYTDSTDNEQILFATSIDQSNLREIVVPAAIPIEDVEGDGKPKFASGTMICSDGSFVKPPTPCKRRS